MTDARASAPEVQAMQPAEEHDAAEREAAEQAARSVAPVAADVEAIGALSADTRKALFILLSSLADNKYVLGRRYAEWCTGAPMLESAVAAAAMAQDELGHARSFYPLLRGFPEASAAATAEEHGWQARPTKAVAFLDGSFDGWPAFIAANFLFDTSLTVLFESAVDSPYEPLAQRARKIVQEEQDHWVHGENWVRRLGTADDTRPGLVNSLEAVWDHGFTWYGPSDDPVLKQLRREGFLKHAPDELRQRLAERLQPMLAQVGLDKSLAKRALPWAQWDPAERRLRRSA